MLDQLSPAAPARVRVVLLPIGQIKRARFLSFVGRLQPHNVVQLGDVSPDGRPNRNMFSPLAAPTGMIVYDLTTHYPPESHLALSPFELYREPLVIIAVADGAELDQIPFKGSAARKILSGSNATTKDHNLRELHQDLEDVRDRYTKALVHQVLVFDYIHDKAATPLPDGLVAVPPPADCKLTTLKTVMCDVSSLLLAEMTTLARSLQALHTIESPAHLQGNAQFNGGSWQSGQSDGAARRNSLLPENDSRNGSTTGNDRSQARMSMPAHLLRSITDSPSHSSAGTAPSDEFEDIAQVTGAARGAPARLGSASNVRDISRDRVSISGFGPGTISERTRNKGKGRIHIAIGSMYMCAGRWNDALKDLVEGVLVARLGLDHLWHAKALDNILVCMIMLAWTGLDFQIPQVCYSTPERPASNGSAEPSSPASNRNVALQNLEVLLPELLERIMNLYERSANNTEESLPQFPFSETVIRFSKLLSYIHLAGGKLNDGVLQLLVLGQPFSDAPNVTIPRLNIRPRRTEIVKTLFRAFPKFSSSENVTVVDRIIILSGIASVLGSLGFNRKKAMVIRELIAVMIPGLVRARLKGAADMGVHPAAGLAALNSTNGNTNGAGALDLGEGDMEQGVDVFLSLLNRIYGVATFHSPGLANGPPDDSDAATIARIIQNASDRYFGGRSLKIDVLRSCIDLSEALPDFNGVLKFSADLLRTMGSGIAPGSRSEDALPSIAREEQIRLANNISRTMSAAVGMDVQDLSAEYWDEFLVRGVELEALPPSRTPIPHSKSDLPGVTHVATSQQVQPFIYNPFLRAPNAAAVDHLMVTGEKAVFKVTLQNPYEFDVEIESIKLESEGAEFESLVHKTAIGPYRTQILMVSGTPRESGTLRIVGCIIKVRGCRERRFPIFAEAWMPQAEVKVKTIGLAGILEPKFRPNSVIGAVPVKISPSMPAPKVKQLGLNVVAQQPIVVVRSTTLSQSALMVLDGERQRFGITLENLSKDTPVDLLLFSFDDSTQSPLQVKMSNRDASPTELYEYELLLAQKQALRWIQKDTEKPYIAPGGRATFEMEILGKPGLQNAVVHIDYAHLGVPQTEVEDQFHTRQVSLPLTITVNTSVELINMEFLPLTAELPGALWSKLNVTQQQQPADYTPADYCLLVLDVRNMWPNHLHLHLEIEGAGTIDEDLLPGVATRIMFPIRRVFLENPSAAIPALDPSRQRQFVVSSGRISAENERATREAFWFREEILKMLRGSWNTLTGLPRAGEIDLRGVRLTQKNVDILRVDEVGVEVEVDGKAGKSVLEVDGFHEVRVRVRNRGNATLQSLVRVQPCLRRVEGMGVGLDLSRKFVWNGVLQETLPPIAAGEVHEMVLGVTVLARGEYEICASVEETRVVEAKKESEGKGRKRAGTQEMVDTVLGAKERRIWYGRETCLLVVRDADDNSGEEE